MKKLSYACIAFAAGILPACVDVDHVVADGNVAGRSGVNATQGGAGLGANTGLGGATSVGGATSTDETGGTTSVGGAAAGGATWGGATSGGTATAGGATARGGSTSIGGTAGAIATTLAGATSFGGTVTAGGANSLGGASATAGSATGGSAGAAGSCGDPIVKARYASCSAASTSDSCVALGGTWSQLTINPSGPFGCRCPSGDSECPCSRASDCSAACVAAADTPLGSCGTVSAGRCTAGPVLGCYCLFQSTPGTALPICWD